MPKRTKLEGPATPEQIDAALKTHTQPHQQKRLVAVGMAQQGKWTRGQISEALGKGRSTINRWLAAYRTGGIKGLLRRGYLGKRPTLTPDDIDALEQEVPTGRFKTAKQIGHWLSSQRGKQLKKGGVYYWLNRIKARHNVPRKAHAKQDPNEKEAFKRQIGGHLDAFGIPPSVPVRIWVEDEHRYGLISNVRRCWTLRGHRVVVPHQTKYEWGYLYGAAELV